MRAGLGEIDAGVRESYGDVRELLVHFRTRANAEDIEPALLTTLRKFEHQTGLAGASCRCRATACRSRRTCRSRCCTSCRKRCPTCASTPTPTQVWLDVQQQPQWRFEVRDDGMGFVGGDGRADETHVGLRIMAERAERIGATLEVAVDARAAARRSC